MLIVQQNRSFVISPSSVTSGSVITASWNMPIDEASNSDWIGVCFYFDSVQNHGE